MFNIKERTTEQMGGLENRVASAAINESFEAQLISWEVAIRQTWRVAAFQRL